MVGLEQAEASRFKAVLWNYCFASSGGGGDWKEKSLEWRRPLWDGIEVLEALDFLIPGYVTADCTASKEQASSKGNLGNNLVTDGEDSWGQDTASGAGVRAM